MFYSNFGSLDAIYPVKKLLETIGLEKVKENGDYFLFSSPFREDVNPSMVMYKSSLFCIDFANDYKIHLHSLITKMVGMNAIEYIESISGIRAGDILFPHSVDNMKTMFKTKKVSPQKYVKSIEGEFSDISSDNDARLYCRSRCITKEFRDTFDISIMKEGRINSTPFYNRLCIPIKERGKIVCIEGRDYTHKSRVKVLYPKDTKTATLFNLENLNKNETLYIVEGITDIPKVWSSFSKNITCTFGITLSTPQKMLINKFPDVVLFPDGDAGGRKFIQSFLDFYNYDFQIAYIEGKDPCEASRSEIEWALTHTQSSVDWKIDTLNLINSTKKHNLFP